MKTLLPFFFLFALLFSSCGGCSERSAKEEASDALSDAQYETEKAMQEARKAMEQLQGGEAKEPVHFRKLQEFLPEKSGDFSLVDKSGETAGGFGVTVSTAKGELRDEDNRTIFIELVDTGGIGMAVMGMAAWSNVVVDKEDSRGYERTSTLNGYKCFEKYRHDGPNAELSILIANRYVLVLRGRNVTMEELKAIAEDLDLDNLARLT
ncbi:MAG: hypothetical protein D6765_14770 [Bacteroidetes bacterium]|nr:MAG: hypothetical protein D6765_14770 [Bacteroidota bacterium]